MAPSAFDSGAFRARLRLTLLLTDDSTSIVEEVRGREKCREGLAKRYAAFQVRRAKANGACIACGA